MPIRYLTEAVPERDQFDFWQEAACEAYIQIGCETDSTERFEGGIVLERFPRISVSSVFSDKLIVNRRKEDIVRSKDDCYLFNLQLKNKGFVLQHNRFAELHAGDFAIHSSTDIYQLRFPGSYHQVVFQFPKSELLTRLPNCDLLTAQKVGKETGIGQLVYAGLIDISRLINKSGELVQQCLQDTVFDLIATGLASLNDSKFELKQPDQYLLLRAKSYIHAHLGNPDLNRETVAKAMNVSIRKLSDVFAKEGSTIAVYIRFRRLEKVASDLSNKLFHNQTISEIAFRWGFNNLQHFSMVFKKQFGIPPRDYRYQKLPKASI